MADRPSIIGPELEVIGTLVSAGDLSVDGNIKGDIRAKGHVTVNQGGKVIGNLYADQVTARGVIEGGVFAKTVHLGSTCHVKGDLLHARLAIEEGAFFDGNCRHSENPASKAPELKEGASTAVRE
ncbi:MAG TPA: polymer-forming cytoskeletal protein [Micropepsaceae bacterium]|nr:polymer-forming cytoskeletal protein [Micropepsaceae bacterium]